MGAKRQFRSRDSVEVDILDALVDRAGEGMTVFELRRSVDADIDEIERALASLKGDGLIAVDENGERAVILPDDRVVPDEPGEDAAPPSILEEIRRRLPF